MSLFDETTRIGAIADPHERLIAFIAAREDIRNRRGEGRRWPWTSDWILQTYRFCNIHREDDRTTQDIAAMWRELLGVETVGSHDDFFLLGGTSLVASLLLARLREAFDVEVLMRHIFEYPRLDMLSQMIEALFIEKLEALPEEEQEDERAEDVDEHARTLALEELGT